MGSRLISLKFLDLTPMSKRVYLRVAPENSGWNPLGIRAFKKINRIPSDLFLFSVSRVLQTLATHVECLCMACADRWYAAGDLTTPLELGERFI